MADSDTIAAVKALVEGVPGISTALPGGVLDRRIMRNVSTDPDHPTPGSTPSAFDVPSGRIRRCVSIVGGVQGEIPSRVEHAYFDSIELWFWCLPHRSEKQIIDSLILDVKRQLDHQPIATQGAGAHLRWVGTLPFYDDVDVGNAVSKRATVQINGIWR